MTKEKKYAWAIEMTINDFDGKVYKSFVGIFAFGIWQTAIPDCQEGFRIALFKSRQKAREAKKTLYSSKMFSYKVKRVKIIVKEVK